MIFLIFTCMAALAALLPSRIRAIYAVLLIVCVFPSGNAYSEIISLQGVYFYDAFVVAYILRVLCETAYSRRFTFNVGFYVALMLCLHILLLLVVVPFVEVDKFYLKDIRPVLNIMFFVTAYDLFVKSAVKFSDKRISQLAVIAGVSAFIKFFILRTGVYGYQDEYYESNSFRYLDASAYICVVYLLSFVMKKFVLSAVGVFSLLASVAAILLANSRFILLSIVVAFLSSSVKKPSRLLYGGVATCALSFAFYFVSSALGVERVIDNLSIDRLYFQFMVRFGPAFELLNEFSVWNYIFGMGAGTSFYIPWFEYRGLESDHSNIDSAYLTYIVKYGALGLLLLIGFVYAAIPKSLHSTQMRIFLLSMFLVSATPYQPYAIGLVFSCLYVVRK